MDDLAKDCSNSSVLAMELLQSCTKPLTYTQLHHSFVWDVIILPNPNLETYSETCL